jgi:hypothetical protein
MIGTRRPSRRSALACLASRRGLGSAPALASPSKAWRRVAGALSYRESKRSGHFAHSSGANLTLGTRRFGRSDSRNRPKAEGRCY